MVKEYTAIVKQDGDWWIGWVEEIPGVNCQEKTHDDLVESFKLLFRKHLRLIKRMQFPQLGRASKR